MEKPLADLALKIFHTACESVMPSKLVTEAIKFTTAHNCDKLLVSGQEFSLNHNLYVVAFGKASLSMSWAVEKLFHAHIVKGIASIPKGSLETFKDNVRLRNFLPMSDSKIVYLEGAEHNLPDEASHRTSLQIYDLLDSLGQNSILLVLISGGGSALLSAPVSGISLADKLSITRLLSRRGASIEELNTVRQHISMLKAGKLAEVAYPAKVISLIFSDIIGNPLHLIASGPTAAPRSTVEDAQKICSKYNITEADVPTVMKTLAKLAHNEPRQKKLDHVTNVLIGDNLTALRAAKLQAASEFNCEAVIVSNVVQGDARDLGEELAKFMLHVLNKICLLKNYGSHDEFFDEDGYTSFKHFVSSTTVLDTVNAAIATAVVLNKPICFLFGGESTVKVSGASRGLGGRSQHCSLSFFLYLAQCLANGKSRVLSDIVNNSHSVDVSLLCGGTDGQDGPTDAAGVYLKPFEVVTSLSKSIEDAQRELENCNSYGFWSEFEEGRFLLKTGLTGTNVMDLTVLVISA